MTSWTLYINLLHIFNFDYVSTGFNFIYVIVCVYPTKFAQVFHLLNLSRLNILNHTYSIYLRFRKGLLYSVC